MTRVLIAAIALIACSAGAEQQPTTSVCTAGSCFYSFVGVNGVITQTQFVTGPITVYSDGTVKIREGTKLDDASQQFWVALQRMGMKLTPRCETE